MCSRHWSTSFVFSLIVNDVAQYSQHAHSDLILHEVVQVAMKVLLGERKVWPLSIVLVEEVVHALDKYIHAPPSRSLC